MSKIPFSIKFRPQIESGEYKVFAYEHEKQEARIVCWDNKGEYPIVALVDNEPEKFDKYGRVPGGNRGGEFSLFIVTPEEELTDWEKAVGLALSDYQLLARDKDGIANIHDIEEFTKKKAAELLSLAKEQFIKDGYIIEKKTFYDAVEKINPEVIKEVSENVDLENFIHDLSERYPEVSFAKLTRIAKAAYDYGKAEVLKDLEESGRVHCKSYDIGYDDGMKDALKDLPRWKKAERDVDAGTIDFAVFHKNDGGDHEDWFSVEATNRLYKDEYYLELSDLEKLSGFKDDKSHE